MKPGDPLRALLDRLRTSLWFLPTAILASSCVLAWAMLALDRSLPASRIDELPLVFDAGPAAARTVLSTIGGSMITVAGVVFSIAIVVLTLAASQYSPRVVRNFMRDQLSQVMLGVFAGVFAYCLLVLGAVPGDGDGDPGWVPAISVSVGIASALAAIVLLVLYIHHIARAIQPAHILDAAARETLLAVECLFPEGLGDEPPQGAAEPDLSRPAAEVTAACLGYVQRVDVEKLLELAQAHSVVLRMECHVGEFVSRGSPLASVHGTLGGAHGDLEHGVRKAFAIGRFQTVEQDPGYGLREIVDLALRALSPGINDETSAAEAIDYTGAILERMAARPLPARCRWREGAPRVVVRAADVPWMLELGFGQVVRAGSRSPQILARVLGALERVARVAGPGCVPALREVALRIERAAVQGVEDREDRAALLQRVHVLADALGAGASGNLT